VDFSHSLTKPDKVSFTSAGVVSFRRVATRPEVNACLTSSVKEIFPAERDSTRVKII
jgi:hypothetical protein